MSRRLLLVLLALAALLAGCKVDATVDVRVREDGSGVVRVIVEADAEAVRAAESGGTPIEQAVRLDDLRDAGFRVGEWEKDGDGSATIVVSRPFDSVDEVSGIVEALGGPDGPLPSLDATVDKGLYATDYSVKGRIDLDSVTTGVTDDEELVQRLAALGVDVNVIDQQLLAQVQSSFGLKVVVRLPDQAPMTFTPKDDATTATVNASAQVLNMERIIFAGAAVGFLLLAIVVWRRGGKRRRRRRRATPAKEHEVVTPAAPPRARGGASRPAPRAPGWEGAPQARPPQRGGAPPRRPAPGGGSPRPPGRSGPPGQPPPRPPGRPGPPGPSGGPPRRPPRRPPGP